MKHSIRRAKAILADAIDLVAWRFGYRVTAMATSDLPGIDRFWIRRNAPGGAGPRRLRARDITDDLVDGIDATVLTAGVDASDHRLEIEVIGWAKDGDLWSIDYRVIDGLIPGRRLKPHP